MTFLPHTTILGTLELMEVYEFYDRPVLFACRNTIGVTFLAVWVDGEEKGEIWLYVPMSGLRFEHVRSGFIDLNHAFAEPEGGFVYEVTIPNDSTEQIAVRPQEAKTLPEARLPASNERLSLPTQTLHALVETTVQRATQSRREVIDLSLNFIDDSRTEAPAGKLGSVLQAFQNLINNIGNKMFGKGGPVGRLPQRTVADMQFNVVGFGAGSFKVNMASSSLANLFDDTTVGDSIEEVVRLIQLSENHDELKNRLMDLGPRVTSSYVTLLENINIDLTRLQIEWASPNNHRSGSAAISSEMAQRTAEAVRQFEEESVKEYEVLSTLIGANIRTMKFEIEVAGNRLSGDVEEQAAEVVNGAVLGNQYIAKIREVTIYKSMVEESAVKNYLLGLRVPT